MTSSRKLCKCSSFVLKCLKKVGQLVCASLVMPRMDTCSHPCSSVSHASAAPSALVTVEFRHRFGLLVPLWSSACVVA